MGSGGGRGEGIGRNRSKLERLGLLPVVRLVTEVTVRGRLEVDGLLEVELTH